VAADPSGEIWTDREIDLRVEDHPTPVKEIRRLLKVHRAYEHMNAGDLALEQGDEKVALEQYGAAEKLQPNNLEMKYWHAISLLNIGKPGQALPILKEVFRADSNWRLLIPRLIEPGLLTIDEQLLKKIMVLE
jgi:predicted Zn-dependent protease